MERVFGFSFLRVNMYKYFSGSATNEENCCKLTCVYSGGQTGADRAGLEVARDMGLETGGWAPVGYYTTDGPDPSLRAFGLRELTERDTTAKMYIARSMRNVDDTDGTIVFRTRDSPGTDKTIGYCWTGKWRNIPRKVLPIREHRPVLTISKMDDGDADRVVEFLLRFSIRKLNIAGHRDTDVSRPWQKKVYTFLRGALEKALQK